MAVLSIPFHEISTYLTHSQFRCMLVCLLHHKSSTLLNAYFIQSSKINILYRFSPAWNWNLNCWRWLNKRSWWKISIHFDFDNEGFSLFHFVNKLIVWVDENAPLNYTGWLWFIQVNRHTSISDVQCERIFLHLICSLTYSQCQNQLFPTICLFWLYERRRKLFYDWMHWATLKIIMM